MKPTTRSLAAAIVAVALTSIAPARARPGREQPVLGTRDGPILTVGASRFRDLDRNGRLDAYEDWRLPVARRVDDLVARMTLAEKVGAMMHATLPGAGDPVGRSTTGYDPAGVARLVLDRKITSAISRLALTPSALAEQNNAVQRIAERGRLGIPVTISTDPRHHFQYVLGASADGGGFSQWPEPLGFAALDDPALTRRFGDIARTEYRAVGIHMALSPQADLATEPRWSRMTGTFGADPDLAGRMVRAYVEGFQHGAGGTTRDGVATVVKHWVGYGASVDGFDGHNRYGRIARLDDASFAVHVRPFLGAFAANVAGVMPTYPILEGVTLAGRPLEPVAAGFNRQLLTDLLRRRYRYRGIVVSDWGITRDCDPTCLAPDAAHPQKAPSIAMPWGVEALSPADRYVKGVAAGIDQFGGTDDVGPLIAAARDGHIAEARLDESVRRIMALKFEQGLFENPYVDPIAAARVVGSGAFVAAGAAAQRASQVLLEQRMGTLPLKARRLFVHGMDPKVVAGYGFVVVTDPAQADAAIVRTDAPFETLHPDHFFGSRQHEGRLDFRAGDAAYDAIVRASAHVPTFVSIFLDRPAILTNVRDKASVILANFGASDAAVLDVLTGLAQARGRLPFELPASMAAVRAQDGARPDDSITPLYRFGIGGLRQR